MDMAVDQARHFRSQLKSCRISEIGIRPAYQLSEDARRISGWRCGRIVTEAGRLLGVFGRRWPHYGNWLQVIWDLHFRPVERDRCEVFYHQPLASPKFLTLSYVHAGARTSISTLYLAALVLDEIARIRKADAIVSHVTNDRITDRLMQRWGWEPHCLKWRGRHFIRRFYGSYPDLPTHWRNRLAIDNSGCSMKTTIAANASQPR